MDRVEKTDSFSTAAEKSYKTISEKILTGEFKPGFKLSQRKMAELTGVSIIPVIEALKRLEEDGLVESKPQWGSFVTIPTPEKVKDMYCLREAIECQVVRTLAEKITPAQERELRQMANELDNIEYTPDTYDSIRSFHYKFHCKLAEYTGFNSLINSLKRINLFWILCKAVSARRVESPLPKNWHNRLIDAIMTGNPEKADAVMRDHIRGSLNPILKNLVEYENINF